MKPHKTKLMNLRDTMRCLKYIAGSPSQEYGGFNLHTVMIAKSALYHIKKRK